MKLIFCFTNLWSCVLRESEQTCDNSVLEDPKSKVFDASPRFQILYMLYLESAVYKSRLHILLSSDV